MVLKQQGAAWGAVQVWLPDEQETDILAGTLDHTLVTYGMFSDVDTLARRRGLDWLVRPETQLLYPRANGTTGSFYPDLLVALGVVLGSTEPYRVTAVGKAPEFIMETLSPHTETNDTREQDGKIDAYAQLGVYEYLIVDPGLHGAPRMVGRRLLAPGRYALIPEAPDGGLWLESLGLWITLEAGDGTVVVGPRLRLSTAGGERLPHLEEEAAELQRERRARIEAEQARAAAEARAQQAEEALRRQREQMDAIRAELERLRVVLDRQSQ
jgi:Uma2 family endonuclease